MSDLYANSPRDALVAKRDALVATISNLGRVQYRFAALSGDEQIALTDAMLAVRADLAQVRAAIRRIDETIRPLTDAPIPDSDIDVFVLSDVA